jgi:hypothetical protein
MAKRGWDEFTLDEAYMCDITHREMRYPEVNDKHDLVKSLKGEGVIISIWSECHPEFERFRCQLEKDGYISVERMWHNGDRVLKPFRLNGFLFRKGAQFPCAPAMSIYLHIQKKYRKKNETKRFSIVA